MEIPKKLQDMIEERADLSGDPYTGFHGSNPYTTYILGATEIAEVLWKELEEMGKVLEYCKTGYHSEGKSECRPCHAKEYLTQFEERWFK